MGERPRVLFVYGTLLRGGANSFLLDEAEFLSAARTRPEFEMADLSLYPALVRSGGESFDGELYSVPRDCLAALDRLEGHPHFYSRTPISLESGVKAEAYLLDAEKAEGLPRVAPGRWKASVPDSEFYRARSRRIQTRWTGRLRLGDAETQVGILDISLLGALLSSEVNFDIGDECTLIVDELPPGIEVGCVVRNSVKTADMFGVEFTDGAESHSLLRLAVSASPIKPSSR